MSGLAQLALHRRNIDTFEQTVRIRKTVGDKKGLFHIGPQQTLFADFEEDDPLFQFGAFIYEDGKLKAEGVLLVNGITIELEGKLDDIEELIIGPSANFILRYCSFAFQFMAIQTVSQAPFPTCNTTKCTFKCALP